MGLPWAWPPRRGRRGPNPHPDSLAPLVEQLGADRFADREAAAAALEKLGPPAIAALRAAADSESPEVRERAAALLTRLRRTADSNARLSPKRVALDYQNVSLGSAVNDLKARTGLPLTLDPTRVANPLRLVACKTGELPAWEAVEAFCQAAGLREAFRADFDVPKPPPSTTRRGYVPPPPPPNADAVAVVLIDGVSEKLPGDRSTAVRVLALPPAFPGHRVTLGTGEVTLALDVTPAPGFGWHEVTGVRISKVIDSEGRAGGAGTEKEASPGFDPTGNVVFARPGVVMRFDINGNSIPPETLANPRVVSVPLRLATPSARSLKRLEGSVFADIQVPDQQLITVADPKGNVNASYGGPNEMKFMVLEVKEPAGAGGLGSVRVQLTSPSPWAVSMRRRGWNPGWPESPRMTQPNRVEAFDAAGKRVSLPASATIDYSGDGQLTVHTYTMTFTAEQGVPAKLAVVGPKQTTVEVPFVMENVRLP